MTKGGIKFYLKRAIGVVIAIMSIVCFASLIARNDYLIRNRPKEPQPELDRVYEFRDHYTVVYVTKQEESDFHRLEFTSFGLIASCIIYFYLFDPFDQAKEKREIYKS